MKHAASLAGLSAILLLGNAPPRASDPSAADVASLETDTYSHRSFPQQPVMRWEEEFRRAIAHGSLDGAAAALAPRYDLTTAEMREIGRLWIIGRARSLNGRRGEAEIAATRGQWLALLARNRRAPLVLQMVAEGLYELDECSADDFAAMMAGSADRASDAWTIASRAPCAGNFLRAAAAAPGLTMPALVRLTQYDPLRAADQLPLFQWLTSPAALARIDDASRPTLAAWLYAQRAKLLFQTGLVDRAVALIEGLPADLRARVLALPAGGFTARVDGLPITIQVEHPDESVKLALAVAYAVGGRTAEAETLFRSLTMVPAARHAFDCAWRTDWPTADRSCSNIPFEQTIGQTIDLLLLDHLLHHPDDDPYPLAEAAFSGSFGGTASDALVELRCQVFSEPSLASICDDTRNLRRDLILGESSDGSDDHAGEAAALDALSLPGVAEARGEIAPRFASFATAGGAAGRRESSNRPPVIAAAAPFAELALPPAFRGPRPPPTRPTRDVAALPEGFIPVRFERNGNRAVVISLSQNYDPTGEVSQGGYWVHLSRDGGRHWDRPLYTGLADRFPYVVPPASRMPMLNGERLDLEVEVDELDTATITYPPVALRSRRRATNLYLQIPLAALARDSDGDGISDIAAQRLLLDHAHRDGGTPFIVGTDTGGACGPTDQERAARIALLGRLFNEGNRALVEPLDRPQGDAGLVTGWRGAAAAFDSPVFLDGDARDYFCLRTRRPIVVYGDRDLAELRRFHPDFHAVEVPRIVFNRARDRGYVDWSAGWTGGTYRLHLVNGAWTVESISSWIT